MRINVKCEETQVYYKLDLFFVVLALIFQHDNVLLFKLTAEILLHSLGAINTRSQSL